MSDFESQEPRDFQQDNPRKRQNVAKRALIYGFKNPNGDPNTRQIWARSKAVSDC
jgi:hypothetical protein